nr:hypothetical protein [Escherichia coli]
MPAFEWVHVQLHQQKGMISLSPPTICNSADLPLPPHNATSCQHNMWYLIQLLMTLYVVSSP